MSGRDDERLLMTVVAQCRRRIQLVIFLRHAAFGGAVAFTAAAALLAGGALLPWPAAIAYATALALGWGVVVALRRVPSPLETAASLDRMLHLDDSVVAALQSDGASSAVRPLVVRQALAGTSGITPRVVFPLAIVRPGLSFAAGLIVLMISIVLETPPRAHQRVATSGALEGAGGSDSSAADRAAWESSGQRQMPGHAGGTRTADQTAGRAGGGDVRRPSQSSAEPAAIDDRSESESTPSESAAVPTAADGTSRTINPTGPAFSGAGGEAAADVGLPSGGGGDGAARGGGGNALGRGPAAGGIAGGRLVDGTVPSSGNSRRPEDAIGTARRDGAGDASAAYDAVAPELRPYVRAYFEAIRRGRD
jgi:hypothetical protein